MEKRKSTFNLIGLPEKFGEVLLSFTFILMVSPYLAGLDFGIFKIPRFQPAARDTLQIVGPVAFIICLLLFVPVWKSRVDGTGKPPEKTTVKAHHKRDFLAFCCRLFESNPTANDHFAIFYFSEDVYRQYLDEQRQSLEDALSIADRRGSIDASYTKAISKMRRDWHQYQPAYKHKLIQYLKNSPVGTEFEGMLFLTDDEEKQLLEDD